MKNSKRLGFVFLAVALLALAAALYFYWDSTRIPYNPPAPSFTPAPVVTINPTPFATIQPAPTATAAPALEDDGLPHDKLFITPERKKYQDSDLQLIIPILEVDVPILNGVDAQTLLRGVGLYDYAQLPGEGNRNVSIAGHRNGLKNGKITDNMPFYYIDTLVEGDYLYLTDSENVYQYVYDSTEVVEADDWGPIYSQGFSCLTLTSCTPIGVADHRIIVRGRLVQIYPYTEGCAYPAQKSAQTQPT